MTSTLILLVLTGCSDDANRHGHTVPEAPVVEDTASTRSTGDTTVSWSTGVVSATGVRDSAVDDTNDTFRGVIPGTPTGGTDADTDALNETALVCSFGETADCNNVCYPSYFLGDGICDDGTDFPSDFDCDAFHDDMGDCNEGSPPSTQPCPLLLVFHTESWATEIGFSLVDAAGNDVLTAGSGFLPNNYATYEFPIWLEGGTYTFEMTDSYGDGWHGGYVELLDPFTGDLIAGGSTDGTISYGTSGSFGVEFTCSPGATAPATNCSELTLTVDTHQMVGDFADEIGWELLDEQGNLIDDADYGSYDNDTLTSTTWDLDNGLYTFRMKDEYTNGWDGATFDIVDGRSLTLLAGTKSNNTETQDGLFQVACSTTYTAPPLLVDCSQLDLRVIADAGASEIGMEIHQIHEGLIGSFAPGTLVDPTWDTTTHLFDDLDPGWISPWTSTDYTVLLLDEPAGGAAPDGWGASHAELYDVTTDVVYRTWGPGITGGLHSATFTLLCTNEMVVPGLPTSGGCTSDTVVDCDGICWPASYVGDGICDDGVEYAPNFACEALDHDDGDCEDP